MATTGIKTRRAIINALAFSGSNFFSVLCLKIQLTRNERDMTKLLKICNELK